MSDILNMAIGFSPLSVFFQQIANGLSRDPLVLIFMLATGLASGLLIGYMSGVKQGRAEEKQKDGNTDSSSSGGLRRDAWLQKLWLFLSALWLTRAITDMSIRSFVVASLRCLGVKLFLPRSGETLERSDSGNKLNGASSMGARAGCDSSSSEWVTEDDLQYFRDVVERNQVADGATAWEKIISQSTPDVEYEAWRRRLQSGSTQYLSRTVTENVTPDENNRFFLNDSVRSEWDLMLTDSAILEAPASSEPDGISEANRAEHSEVVMWQRRLPLVRKQRDYVFGRRTWVQDDATLAAAGGGTVYTITRSVEHPQFRDRDQLVRVRDYFSAWSCRAVLGKKGERNSTDKSACEVFLLHQEDVGIPERVARFAIKQRMWPVVQSLLLLLRQVQRMLPSLRKFVDSEREAISSRQAQCEADTVERSRRHHRVDSDGDGDGDDNASERSHQPFEQSARCEPKRRGVLDRVKAVLIASGGGILLRHVVNQAMMTQGRHGKRR